MTKVFNSNVSIQTDGTINGTKLLVDDIEIRGVKSIEIEKIQPDSGQIEITVKIIGVKTVSPKIDKFEEYNDKLR